MRYSTLTFASLLASAAALPALEKRQESTFDKNGNLKLTFSKATVQIGIEKIDDIFSQLGQACHETGQCESNDISISSQLIGESTVDDITITLGPAGAYPTWIRNGLLDALKAAVLKAAKCEDVKHTTTCPNPAVYCPNAGTTTYNECEVPAFWGINYQVPDEANSSPPWLQTDITVEKEGAGAICTDILSAAGGVAGIASVSEIGGAIAGVAGGIFTLLSLACT